MSVSSVEFFEADPHDIWCNHGLDPWECAQMRKLLKTYERNFKAGAVLRHDGDDSQAIYFVTSGWAKLSKSLPDGQVQILDFGLPGNFFSLTAADSRTSVFDVEAITDCTVSIVPTEDWIAVGKACPQVSKMMQKEISATNTRIAERVLRLGRGSAEERLAFAFLELGIRTGAMFENNTGTFHLPITQQQIGDFVGLTSVHVCRTLRRLGRKGTLATEDHIDLHLLDVAAVEELAGITVADLSREILAFH